MIDFLFGNRDIINLFLGLIIGLIPSLWEIRSTRIDKESGIKKHTFNKTGIFFISLIFLFMGFSTMILWLERKSIKEGDIYVEFGLRPDQISLDYNKISEILPKEVKPSMIRIEDYEVKGDFVLDLSHLSRARSFSTIFAYYKCYLKIENKTNKRKLILIEDIDPKTVKIYLPIEEVIKTGFTVDSPPRLFIRGKQYEGELYIKKGEISF